MNFARTYLSFAITSVFSASVYANINSNLADTPINNENIQLSPLVLKATELKQDIGKMVYNKDEIDKSPNSSKNITDFLKKIRVYSFQIILKMD